MQPSTRPCARRCVGNYRKFPPNCGEASRRFKKTSQNNTCETRRHLTRCAQGSFRFGRLAEAVSGGTFSDSRGSYRSFASILCVHPQESACWTIKQPPEWLLALAPYLRDICSGLRASMPLVGVATGVAGGPIGAAAGLTASAAIEFIANYVTPMQDLADRLHAMATEACETPGLIEASAGCGKQQADALRLFWKLLDEFDGSLQPAGLHKVLTQDGNCLWLCDKHYALR